MYIFCIIISINIRKMVEYVYLKFIVLCAYKLNISKLLLVTHSKLSHTLSCHKKIKNDISNMGGIAFKDTDFSKIPNFSTGALSVFLIMTNHFFHAM